MGENILQNFKRKTPTKEAEQLKLFDVEDIYDKEWKGMPEFNNFEKAVKQIILHFETWDDVKSFELLTEQKITESTKSMWYPKKKTIKTSHLEYKSEP